MFGIVSETREKTMYGCFVGSVLSFSVKYGEECERLLNLKEKREYMKFQREFERERDKLTTKIYHLQLLIDNCEV